MKARIAIAATAVLGVVVLRLVALPEATSAAAAATALLGLIALWALAGRSLRTPIRHWKGVALLSATVLLTPGVALAHWPDMDGWQWTCVGGGNWENGACFVHHTTATARWNFAQSMPSNAAAAIRRGEDDWDQTFSHQFNFSEVSGSYVKVYWKTSDPCGKAGWLGCAQQAYDPATNHLYEDGNWISLESDQNWNMCPTCTSFDGYDLWAVAAHEFGHIAGLGHSTSSSATMSGIAAGSTQERTLNSWDRHGRCQIYGHTHDYWGGCTPE